MPIYEYKCHTCGEDFDELIRSQSEEKSIICPNCSGRQITRKMSLFGFSSESKGMSSSTSGISCTTCASKNCASCH